MITIYGSPKSSAGRCFWSLEETEVSYETTPVSFKDQEHKSEEFLKINPNGKIPALTDGDFIVWESMAINFYIADAYKPELLGTNAQERGLVHQWSIWSIADVQPPLIAMFIQQFFVPEERRDLKLIEKSKAKLPKLFNTLNQGLEDQQFLVNNSFTLADLNVASVVAICKELKIELSDYPNMSSWLHQLSERPAFKRYQEIANAEG